MKEALMWYGFALVALVINVAILQWRMNTLENIFRKILVVAQVAKTIADAPKGGNT